MNLIQNANRLATLALIVLATALAGCASTVSIDPTRTSMLATHSVSAGADGQQTTETIRLACIPGRVTDELKAVYEKNAAQAIADGVCKPVDENRIAAVGPSLAGDITKGLVNTASGGLMNLGVQTRLQRQQQKFCAKTDSCGNRTYNQNINNSESASGAMVDVKESTVVKVDVNTPSQPACVSAGNCGK